MFRNLLLLFSFFLFVSCDFFNKKEEVKSTEKIIASIGEANLYDSEIKAVLPQKTSFGDSIIFVKSYINSWAKKQLLLQKAQENISEINDNEIKRLVKDYRESLFINNYKEKIIKQQLDTVISNQEILQYYNSNRENFKLNEELFQIKYVYYGKNFIDKKEVAKYFKSNKDEDLEALERYTINFKDYHLRDLTWMKLDDILLKIPSLRNYPKQKLLKISKFIRRQDSLGVYLVAVNNVLRRNQEAPLSYVQNNIKQLILHKRKKDLIREIEKTLINDAIKNNELKEY